MSVRSFFRKTSLVLYTAAGAIVAHSALALEPVELKIASFKQGSSYHVYAVTIGELLRDELPEGSVIDTPPIGGGVANPALVNAGKADIGLSFAVSNSWATKGEVAFEEPMQNVRALVGGLDQYYAVVMANAGGVEGTLNDFLVNEKPDSRVVMLPKGSTGYYASRQLLSIVGSTEKELESRDGSYTYGSFGVVKSGLKSGSFDLFGHVVTVGHPAVTEIALTNDVTFLQPSDATLNEMQTQYGWNVAELPASTFANQDVALQLPATSTSVIVSADMSDELAYLITKVICESVDKLTAGHQALKDFDPKMAWTPELTQMKLHDGAIKYYRQRGWM
jgi:TRAP transporter TAXI family solute receptor